MKKSLSVVLTLIIVVSAFAGCTQSSPSVAPQATTAPQAAVTTPATTSAPEPEKPLVLKLTLVYSATEAPAKNHPMQVALEKYTNTDLEITWLPRQGYEDVVYTSLSSNTLPDIIELLEEKKHAGTLGALADGVFWDIGKYISDPQFKNFSRLDPAALANASVNGKLYGMIRERETSRGAIWYRKDWADTLGIKMPTTVDEYYNMMYRFTFEDPDGNGKADTLGYFINNSNGKYLVNNTMDFTMSMFNVPYRWGVKDGKVTPAFMFDEFINGLNFIKKMKDTGVLNADFVVAVDLTTSGYNDATVGTFNNYNSNAIAALRRAKEIEPKAEFEMIPSFVGEKKYSQMPGYLGLLAIPKSSVKDEAKVLRIMKFFDQLMGDEMTTLLRFGIEGTDYKIENGFVVQTEEQKKQIESREKCFQELKVVFTQPIKPKQTDLEKKVEEINLANAKTSVQNVTVALISPTYMERGAELDKIWHDALTKYVNGDIDKAGWDKAVADFLTAGGQKVIDEYTESYNKSK